MSESEESGGRRSAKERVIQFATDVIYDRRREGRAVKILAAVLRAFSALFGLIVRLRFFLYAHRVLRDTPLGCKVIVVGNLTVGGTGKTPVVEKMARVMAQNGRKVAILSRGYKSKKEPAWKRLLRALKNEPRPEPRVVSDGERILVSDASQSGDEPYMLARNLLPYGVRVVVDRDRVYAGTYAIRKFGVDIIILDDGMQYLPLRGAINLLLVDKTNPFGNGNLLPRGILREPVDHLSRGSYIFLTKSNRLPGEPQSERDRELESEIRRRNPRAEIIECTHKPKRLCPVFDGGDLELDALKDLKIASFSGIATPDKFEEFLRRYGAKIAYNRRFFDHHSFSEKDLEEVFAGAVAAGARLIVTTEKDMVRLSRDLKPPVPLYYLRLEIEIISGKETFEAAVRRICA